MMRRCGLLLWAFCALMFGFFAHVNANAEVRYGKMKFGENLVRNPSFEEDANSDGFPDNWNLPRG